MSTDYNTVEEWRDITGYVGYYQVSNHGRVRSIDRTVPYGNKSHITIKGGIKNPSPNRDGYIRTSLSIGNVSTKIFAHRLVLLEFASNPPTEKHTCNHKNGIKDDNHIDNLEWVTQSENAAYSYRKLGRVANKPFGEAQGNSKLTNESVLEIRGLYATGGYLQRELGKMFGVSQSHISSIVIRTTWKHI